MLCKIMPSEHRPVSVLPEFIAQKKGHIVITSSMAGIKTVPGNAVYCGTKHFVRAMLESFRAESISGNTNIRTTTIYPGAIKTELLNTVAPSETKTMVENSTGMWVWSRMQSRTPCCTPSHSRTMWMYLIWRCAPAWRADGHPLLTVISFYAQ